MRRARTNTERYGAQFRKPPWTEAKRRKTTICPKRFERYEISSILQSSLSPSILLNSYFINCWRIVPQSRKSEQVSTYFAWIYSIRGPYSDGSRWLSYFSRAKSSKISSMWSHHLPYLIASPPGNYNSCTSNNSYPERKSKTIRTTGTFCKGTRRP